MQSLTLHDISPCLLHLPRKLQRKAVGSAPKPTQMDNTAPIDTWGDGSELDSLCFHHVPLFISAYTACMVVETSCEHLKLQHVAA